MNEPYFVEVDQNGCEKCGSGRTWSVVGPDGSALGISYGYEEDADEMAEALNESFDAGRKAGQARGDSENQKAPSPSE